MRNGYVKKRVRTTTRKYYANRSDARGNLYRLVGEEVSEPVEYELRKKDLALGLDHAISVAKAEQEKKSEMRESPPPPPKESKGRNKRTSDGDGVSCDTFLRPRACACRRARAKRKREASAKFLAWLERLDAEGRPDPVRQIVDEAVTVTGGTEDDRWLWIKIANRGLNTFYLTLQEFEADLEKCTRRNKPLRNPRAAFQKRLNTVLPKV